MYVVSVCMMSIVRPTRVAAASAWTASFSDVLIDGCTVHHIGRNGIDVHSNYSWIVPKVQATYDLMADTDVTIQLKTCH
jgi:hypothetical protein